MYKLYSDSTLKGMTKDALIAIIRCLEHNVSVCEERNDNQFRLLMEKEKYKWHDLRKNPNDLPKGQWVMCACRGEQYQVMRMGLDGEWLTWYPDTATYMHSFVIAWREIEPFEEEEYEWR